MIYDESLVLFLCVWLEHDFDHKECPDLYKPDTFPIENFV